MTTSAHLCGPLRHLCAQRCESGASATPLRPLRNPYVVGFRGAEVAEPDGTSKNKINNGPPLRKINKP